MPEVPQVTLVFLIFIFLLYSLLMQILGGSLMFASKAILTLLVVATVL